MQDLPPLLGGWKLGGGVVIESTIPEWTNGQPVCHKELAALRGLTSHKEGRFGNAIASIDEVALHS